MLDGGGIQGESFLREQETFGWWGLVVADDQRS